MRILVLKLPHNLWDEQVAFQLLDRPSFRRFYGLMMAASIPDRTTEWKFENRVGASGAGALFDGLKFQLLRHGYLARGGVCIRQLPAEATEQTRNSVDPSIRCNPKNLAAPVTRRIFAILS